MVQEVENITLDNDAYLLIVYGKDREKVSVVPYDVKVKNSTVNLLNTGLRKMVANGIMAGITSPIAQNIAGKNISNATMGRIRSSIYDIMSDGQVQVPEVAEDFIGSCTNALDNCATDLGYPTPSALYGAIMPVGSGVISKDISNLLAKKMDNENKVKEETENKNKQKASYIKLNLITDDSEDLPIQVLTRRTEKGFNIPMAVNNENKTKTFEVNIIHDDKNGVDMYQVKSRLEELRNLKETFDVYINDKDVLSQYKISNCLFSSLSFKQNGKNSISCSMTIVENPEWDVQIVKLDPIKAPQNTGNGAKKGKGKSGMGNGKGASKLSNQVKQQGQAYKAHAFPTAKSTASMLQTMVDKGWSPEKMAKDSSVAKHGYNAKDIQTWINQGKLKTKPTSSTKMGSIANLK